MKIRIILCALFHPRSRFELARLEKQHSHLTEIKVNEMFCFVSYIGAKIAADDAVPSWVVLLVKLLFNESGNIFLDIIFFQGLRAG